PRKVAESLAKRSVEIAQIRKFIRKRYRLILIGPLLAALIAAIYSYSRPPQYEAESQLAIVKSGVLLNFDPKYQIVSDVNSDLTARRRSLTTLVKSPALAN